MLVRKLRILLRGLGRSGFRKYSLQLQERAASALQHARTRRIQSRRACRLSADVFRLGEGVPNRSTLSDISTGGCYVETPAPFPPQTVVNLVVRTKDLKLRVRGTVQVSHPGFGMGVQFSLNTADEREQVKQLIACQTAEDTLA